MRIELLDSSFLLPSLQRFLTDEGFLVVERDGKVEVLAPDAGSGAEAATLISASAHRWAALRGVPIRLSPVSDRLAHPVALDAQRVHPERSHGPTVSIGLPVFNGARHLPDAITSLLRQTYADFELIVCDNASTDGTVAIAEEFALRDERVVLLHNDVNRGAAWNHNRALAAAHGQYFLWAAHDDVYARTYLERSVETLERAPASVALVFPRAVLIDENGNRIGEPEGSPVHRLAIPSAAYGVMRTELVRRAGGFPIRWTDGFGLLPALAELGELWEIPESLLLRRVKPARGGRRSSRAAIAHWWTGGPSHLLRRAARRRRPTHPFPSEVAPVHDAVRSAVWAVAPDYVQHVRINVDARLEVPFEPRALQTILVNLISNAVRYGAPPITIRVSVAERTVLTVEDEGRGVSEAFEPRLFEPFARSEPSRHDSAGLGLGLAIARLTAEDHGAQLTYEHTPRGTRFQLVFARAVRMTRKQRLTHLGRRLLHEAGPFRRSLLRDLEVKIADMWIGVTRT